MTKQLISLLPVAIILAPLACQSSIDVHTRKVADDKSSSGETEASESADLALAGAEDYIVVLQDGHEPGEHGRTIAREHGVTLGYTYRHALNGYSFKGSASAAAAIARRAGVKLVERDQIFSLIQPMGKPGSGTVVQPAQSIPSGIHRVGGYANAAGKTAWIIDTGIQLTHPDLQVDAARGFTAFRRSSSDDQNGHGTHVAGTIAALDNGIGVVGVAAGATVVPVRVLDRSGSGTTSGVIAGVDHVAALAQAGDVANMSLGGGVSTALDNAVINAAAKGIIFALAAGNESKDAVTSSPGRAEGANIFTISAIDAGTDTFATFSNFGLGVDFAAPGVNVLSTYIGSSYRSLSGTSMATPHAAGVLLLTGGLPASCGQALNDPDQVADPIICRIP